MSKLKTWLWGLVVGAAALVLVFFGRRREPLKVVADAEKRDAPRVQKSEELRAEVKSNVEAAEELRNTPTTGAMTESEAKVKLGGWLK